jgi:hypothetical protein
MVVVKKDAKTNESVSVYPNPFNDQITCTIEANTPNKISLMLIDISGKEVANSSVLVEPGVSTFDFNELGKLKNGVYFLKVLMDNEVKTIKLIKTK